MKKLLPFILSIFLIFGCAGLKKSEKDYTGIFAKSGLNIDANSNDKVDEAYGGTDSDSMEAGLDKVWSSTGILKRTASETYGIAVENTDYAAGSHASRHGYGGADIIDRWFEGVTAAQATLADSNTDFTVVPKGLYYTNGLGSVTIDDFSDASGDHSDFSDGDYIGIICNDSDSTVVIDFSTGTYIVGNLGVDFTGSGSNPVILLFMHYNGVWICLNYNMGFSDPLTLAINSIKMTYTSSGDVNLSEGRIHQKSNEDAIALHGGSSGEVQGEVLISMLHYQCWSIDPGTWYNSDAEWFLMDVESDVYPNGLTIVEWKASCNTASPSPEINADLRYADDWATLGSPSDIDEIDTSSGVSSEDSISSTVAAGKVIYIGFDGDPEGTCVQLIFCMEWYAEED